MSANYKVIVDFSNISTRSKIIQLAEQYGMVLECEFFSLYYLSADKSKARAFARECRDLDGWCEVEAWSTATLKGF
jgi:hypothetical protein